jgi:hypothetical protein
MSLGSRYRASPVSMAEAASGSRRVVRGHVAQPPAMRALRRWHRACLSLLAGGRVNLLKAFLVGSIFLASCAGGGSHAGPGNGGTSDTGTLRVALTAVPVDVACLRLQVDGSGNRVDARFDVTSGAGSVLTLPGLRPGSAAFSSLAYAAACASIDGGVDGATPTWCSDVLQASIRAGAVVDVSVVLHLCGAAKVSVDFEHDSDAGTAPDAGDAGGSLCTPAAAAAAPFAGGSGSPADPFLVCTLAQLDAVRGAYLGSAFRLLADLDASITNPASPANPGSAWDNGGLGWNPIGGCGADGACNTADDAPFAGTFLGGGHTVSGLYIQRGAQDGVGLFGMASGSGVVVRDLTLANATVTGRNDVGAAVGYLQGDLDRCASSGTVAGSPGGTDGVGGLVGAMGTPGGPLTTRTLSSSSSSARVSGASNVGGLAGHLEWGATISRSFATGNVVGLTQLGGLVGYMYNCSVADSFAGSAVTGTSCVGGLAGFIDFSAIARSFAGGAVTATQQASGLIGCGGNTSLSGSFAMGSVTGTSKVGGLFGETWEGNITNSKWDSSDARPDVMCGFVRPDQPTSGCDDAQAVSGQPAYWDSSANPPMSAWDSTIWTFRTDGPPQLSGAAGSQ